MAIDSGASFVPKHLVAPGDTLLETIEQLGWTQAELAERAGRPKKTINEIINGNAAITPQTALQLERVLGIPAELWNTLEQNYRAAVAKQEERARLQPHVEWLKIFPLAELTRRGWLRSCADKVDQLDEVLSYFGVASPDAWDDVWQSTRRATAFRVAKENADNFGIVAAWLRQGERYGQAIPCKPYDAKRFREALSKARALTVEEPKTFYSVLREECSEAGVAVVLVQELPKLGVCGAARWMNPDKALIQLSFHYKRDDQFWFSFFHEAGHILLHGKREIFLDDKGAASSSVEEEEEANSFAADSLLDDWAFRVFANQGELNRDSIVAFAADQGIAPGVVVGRLQRYGYLRHAEQTDLFRRFDWDQIVP